MPNFKLKKCKLCGQEFKPVKSPRQVYCGKIRVKNCAVCGKEIQLECGIPFIETNCCSSECKHKFTYLQRDSKSLSQVKKCKWCGKEFISKSSKALYCEGPHYKNCIICGKEFEINVKIDRYVMTCSKECKYKYASQQHDFEKGVETNRKRMLEKYGVENAFQLPEFREKSKQTSLERYGKEWYTQTDEYKTRVKETSLEKYGVEHHLKAQEVIEKRTETVKEKYGVDNVFQSESVKETSKQTNFIKYGAQYISQVKEIKAKQTRNAKQSKLEERICKLLLNYGVEYQQHYFIKNEHGSHEFDFYIPKYSLLIDADGLYYHSYLEDPNGYRVREDYDEKRLLIVPEGFIFHVVLETQEDRQIKEIIQLLESVDGDIMKYDSALFKWCRSIKFPYPSYSTSRLLTDWKHLNSYTFEKYIPQCRIGQSLVKQFHKSIYKSHVGSFPSPYEGWHDDIKLKQAIKNRFIYKNDVDPSKILAGLTISKIAPCVSSFNPVLAKYLTTKYLSAFDIVFDPFSGYSGRALGVVASNKKYIGQDLNSIAVEESNALIQFLHINDNCNISRKDILESFGEYSCLLTCPPYGTKEIYNNEKVFKSCDDWITECLTRFNCSRYVFVVDNTTKYKDYVKEELKISSHLNNVSELVIVIDN